MPDRERSTVTPFVEAYALARLLYAAETAADAAPDRLFAVTGAGKHLREGLRLARGEPGTLGWRAAPRHAHQGLRELAAIGWSGEIDALIKVAAERLPAE